MKSYNSYIDEAKKKIDKRYRTGQGTKGDQNIRDRDDEEEGTRSKTRPTSEAKKVSADDAEHATALYRDQWKDRHIADYDKQHGRSDRAKEMRADAEVDRKREYAMDPKWKHAKGSSGEVKGKKSIKGNPKEEVEEMNPLMRASIDEISKGKLSGYMSAAADDREHAATVKGVALGDKKRKNREKTLDDAQKRIEKRRAGMDRAASKLSKEEAEFDEKFMSPEGKPKDMKWKYKHTDDGRPTPSRDDKKDARERARSAQAHSSSGSQGSGTSGTGPRKNLGTSGRSGEHTDQPDWSRSSKKGSPHKQSRGVKAKGTTKPAQRITPKSKNPSRLPEEMVDEKNMSPEGKRNSMKWKYKDTPSGQTIPSKDDKKDSKERARSATSVFQDKSGGTAGTGPRKSLGTSGRYGAHTDSPDWSRSSKKDSPHKKSRGVKAKGTKKPAQRVGSVSKDPSRLPEEMIEAPTKKSIWDTWRPRVYAESTVAGAVALPVNQMGGTSIWDLSNGEVLRNVNAFVGSIADREYLIPENAVHQLKGFMERVGLTFPEGIQLPTGNGTISIPLQRWGGTFGKTATTPFDEFENEPENVGLDLKITVEELRNNSWKVYAKIV